MVEGQRSTVSGGRMSVLIKRTMAHDMAAASAYFQQARQAAGTASRPPNPVK